MRTADNFILKKIEMHLENQRIQIAEGWILNSSNLTELDKVVVQTPRCILMSGELHIDEDLKKGSSYFEKKG